MVAISNLRIPFRARTIAASMAIDGPEVTDDASLVDRSEAEDGAGASFLVREEWAQPRGRKS